MRSPARLAAGRGGNLSLTTTNGDLIATTCDKPASQRSQQTSVRCGHSGRPNSALRLAPASAVHRRKAACHMDPPASLSSRSARNVPRSALRFGCARSVVRASGCARGKAGHTLNRREESSRLPEMRSEVMKRRLDTFLGHPGRPIAPPCGAFLSPANNRSSTRTIRCRGLSSDTQP